MNDRYDGPLQRQLLAAVEAANLSIDELWLAYFALGGEAGKVEIDAYMNGLMIFPALQHDILAHAVNEHLGELNPPRAPYHRYGREPVSGEGSGDGQRGTRDGQGDGQDVWDMRSSGGGQELGTHPDGDKPGPPP